MSKKKGFPKDSVCKPCWELKYCPYGYMVEWFPFPLANPNLEEIKKLYSECLVNFTSGKLKTEQDVLNEIDRLMYLTPSTYEYLEQFDPKELSCEMFGHTCPVFITQSGATETQKGRKQGRAVPRDIILKVLRRDNQICQVCHENVKDDEIEFDHVIPYSKGGPTTVENIRLLCRQCNRKKTNSLNEILGK